MLQMWKYRKRIERKVFVAIFYTDKSSHDIFNRKMRASTVHRYSFRGIEDKYIIILL
jgi:hypothetical protein